MYCCICEESDTRTGKELDTGTGKGNETVTGTGKKTFTVKKTGKLTCVKSRVRLPPKYGSVRHTGTGTGTPPWIRLRDARTRALMLRFLSKPWQLFVLQCTHSMERGDKKCRWTCQAGLARIYSRRIYYKKCRWTCHARLASLCRNQIDMPH